MKMKKLFVGVFFIAAGLVALPVFAQNDSDAVMVKDGKTYFVQNDQPELLSYNLQFSHNITVTTNGTFSVGTGKDRLIASGQNLRRDGWLVNSDGSVEPAFDHVMMKAGQVLVVRDGDSSTLSQTMTFPNNLVLQPDGSCVYPDGRRSRLIDGQLFQLDGTPLAGRDTVTMIGGKVVVQKNGSLITLQPVQLMGMEDGTRVFGSGRIEKLDGTVIQLKEGKTILLQGVIVRQ
jgi:hypothetical protein